MTRFRPGSALTILIGLAAYAQAAPIYVPEAEVMDRPAPVVVTRDPARITRAFRAMGENGRPANNIPRILRSTAAVRTSSPGLPTLLPEAIITAAR